MKRTSFPTKEVCTKLGTVQHVVGGADGWAGEIGAGAGTQVWDTRLRHLAQRLHHIQRGEGAQQPERVAAADEHRLRVRHRRGKVTGLVEAGDLDACRGQRLAHDSGVGVWVTAGKRHEQQAAAIT
jgi:hypothetical protein